MDNSDLGRLPSSPGSREPDQQAVPAVPASIPRAKRATAELLRSAKPWNVFELERLSEWYFGKALHLDKLQVWSGGAAYQVAERYNDYHGAGWVHSEHCCRGYDYSRAFWRHVIGELQCGGIAARSYGQTRHSEYEQERLASLEASVAQAIETRRAATGTGAVHESAVGETDAPTPSSEPRLSTLGDGE